MSDSRRYVVIGGGLAGLAEAGKAGHLVGAPAGRGVRARRSPPCGTRIGAHPIGSTNLCLDRPLGTEVQFEALIGGVGVIDEDFDRQLMTGPSTDRAWLHCLTTSGAYERIHKTNDEIVAEQMALESAVHSAAKAVDLLPGLPSVP